MKYSEVFWSIWSILRYFEAFWSIWSIWSISKYLKYFKVFWSTLKYFEVFHSVLFHIVKNLSPYTNQTHNIYSLHTFTVFLPHVAVHHTPSSVRTCVPFAVTQLLSMVTTVTWCFSDRASWIDYILITNFCALIIYS